ncbi:MAG TPA: urease accessory UreF family protein [Methylomirabilota bacterium]|jgi:urease accessory protein
MTPETLLAVLQFADGLFPAGGFAHSFGLETYVQAHTVRDRPDLEAFVIAHLDGGLGPADAVAAAVAAGRAAAGDIEGCIAVDDRLDAMKCVPEFAVASRQMGRQTARVAAAVTGDAWLAALASSVEDGITPGHAAVLFGAVTGRAGADAETAAAAFLHSSVTLLVGAALRLLPLGQLDAQRVLAAVRPRVLAWAGAAAHAVVEDMWSFTPGLDIAGIRHADLEARLFRS